jgi:uncharacterized protein with WD repeat
LSYSPKGTYLLSCSKPKHSGDNNLKIWDLKSGNLVNEYVFKKAPKEAKFFCKWTECESVFCRLSSPNTIDMYLTSEGYVNSKHRIQLDRIETFDFCPIPATQSSVLEKLIIGVTVDMGKDDEGEGIVRFFEYPTHLKKERFKIAVDNAHEINLKFHPRGYAVLIWS